MSRTAYPLTRPTITRLLRALPRETRRLLDAAVAAADELGTELWAVGGAIRDCATGRELRDLDAGVAGDATALAASTAARLGTTYSEKSRFGMASIRSGDHKLELASLRTERYPRPGALPQVQLGATIEQDLPRRDFTVNALALALTGPRRGELLDPFSGLDDLAERRLRALHARSFVDDATRLWRGARLTAELRLRPDPETAHWLKDGPRWLAPISAQRLWTELERTASERRVSAAVRLLAEWGVLRGIHLAWGLPRAADRALARRPGPHPPELLLAVLLGTLPERETIVARLAASRIVKRTVRETVKLLASPDDDPSTLARIEQGGANARKAARWLDPERQRLLQRSLRRWERTASPIDAHTLQQLGVATGPAIGEWLSRLRRERYLGTIRDAASACQEVRTTVAKGNA